MKIHRWIIWNLLQFFYHSWMIVAVVLDMEAPMTSSWLVGDWSNEEVIPEELIQDEDSGCICRLKHRRRVECYGATTCSAFPRNVNLPLGFDDFRLRTTAVVNLTVGDLDDMEILQYLEIDANSHLNYIEPGVFMNMSQLANLSISFNSELKYLSEDTFKGLDNLKRLRLVKNGFQNIIDVAKSFSVNYLPSLESLTLNENIFKELGEDSFEGLDGTNIKELDLILCQIETIHPKAFKHLKKLEKFRIGENLPKEGTFKKLFEFMVEEQTPISLLNLYDVGLRKGKNFTELLKTISKLKVRHLNLRRNHIDSLTEGLFPEMPYLEILDLREVSALEIEPNTLNQGIMPNLKVLLLGGNKLSGVMPGVLLPQLSELDLSGYSGQSLYESYFDVNSNIFENMTKLTSLNLSYNRIATISNMTFNGVDNLKILGLKNATIYFIAENSFSMLRNLYLLNLEDNPVRPFNTFPNSVFEGLENLEILLLSNCKIKYFKRNDVFEPLKRLKYLDLHNNDLNKFEPSLLQPLNALTGLDLSWNHLTPWNHPNRLFENNPLLKIVILSNNRFTYLTQNMMDDFTLLTRLDISGNPFVCDGSFFTITKTFFLSRNLTANNSKLFSPLDRCLSPDEWRDKPIAEFLNNEFFDLKSNTKVIYIFIGVFILFAITISLLCWFYRWYIRYWLFLTRRAYVRYYGRLKRKGKHQSDNYKYDAFVSYSHEDRNFIIRLVAMLENYEPYLKLCVYERDFEIGTVISETVMSKVEASRRTLLVVSDAFARSQWCMWELQLAEFHNLFFKSDVENECCEDSLIMIKLGPIANSHLTPILKYLLKTRIYLEWNPEFKKQKVFWEKLRNSLKPCDKRVVK